MRASVVVVGSLNMDFVVRVKRLPAPGETVLGHSFQMVPGGKGANQAVAAGKLGAQSIHVKMIGRVGLDPFADHLKASLSAANVDVTAVHGTHAQPTGVALIHVEDSGQNSIVVASGANMELHVSAVEAMRRVFKGAKIALFQLETPLDTVTAALKIAREEGLTTILDPAPAQALPAELLAHVDILTPNETEAEALGGHAAIVAQGVRSVIYKLGPKGCVLFASDELMEIPGFAVNAVDTTAAGDTFNGALAVALAEGWPMPHAIRFANAAAAISVTRLGAQSSTPTRAEVDGFLLAASPAG